MTYPAPMTDPAPLTLLNDEGDRLARHLTQTLHVTEHQLTRTTLIGRTLAYNLLQAFSPTLEQITRRAGHPLQAQLTTDDRGRALLHITTPDGEERARLPAEDLLHTLLYTHGRLHPTLHTHLRDALTGDEHHATRALVAALRSKPVMDAMNRELQKLMAQN